MRTLGFLYVAVVYPLLKALLYFGALVTDNSNTSLSAFCENVAEGLTLGTDNNDDEWERSKGSCTETCILSTSVLYSELFNSFPSVLTIGSPCNVDRDMGMPSS